MQDGLNADMEPEELDLGFSLIDKDGNGTIEFDEFAAWWLDRCWQARALRITGNYYADSIEIVGPGAASRGPELKARLDRDFPCYESGSRAAITVESEAGVYIYILNVAADRTVTLIYPTPIFGKKSRSAAIFAFLRKRWRIWSWNSIPWPAKS